MTTLSRTLKVLAAAAVLVPVCIAAAQDKPAPAPAKAPDQVVDLRAKLTKGQTATFVMEQTRKDVTEFPALKLPNGEPAAQHIDSQQAVTYKMTVLEQSEAGATVELKITEIHATADMKTSDGKTGEFKTAAYKYDSTAPTDDSDKDNKLRAALIGLVGAPLTINLDAAGNVLKVDNAGIGKPGNELSGLALTHTAPELVRMRWGPIFNPRKGDGQTKVGQTWTATELQDARPVGRFKFDFTYTLAKASPTEATIDVSGNLALGDIAETEKTQFVLHDPVVAGSILWDVMAGQVSRFEMLQKIALEGSGQGIQLTRTSEVTTKVTRQK